MQYACNFNRDTRNNFGRVISCKVTVEDLGDRSMATDTKEPLKVVDAWDRPRVLSQCM
jgi:hypothetical protein